MTRIIGVGVSRGHAVGPVRQMQPTQTRPPGGKHHSGDVAGETERIRQACKAVQSELRERAACQRTEGKAKGGDVLDATAEMAADPMLITEAIRHIESGQSAQWAIWQAAELVAENLRKLGGYLAERAADVLDVRARIVAELSGLPSPGIPESDTPFVLSAIDLAPADTATLDPDRVLALVTAEGGPQSHTAILARSLGLPAVVAAPGVLEIVDGSDVFVDGVNGVISAPPTAAERELTDEWARNPTAVPSFDGDGRLADGTKIPLLANVGTADDADLAAQARAQGIGLLRTEICFLDRDSEPTMAEQAGQYQKMFEAFAGKKVVVRTLDAGADKPMPFVTDSDEPNPALGVRGFRTSRCRPEILDRQLKAIAVAAGKAAGNGRSAEVWVMAPMVATAEEAQDFVDRCRSAGLPTAGVMVELPSAALACEQLLAHGDFVSLGTNDLTQYTMGADRQLGSLADLNDPWQPAVLQLIAATVNGAQAAASAANQYAAKPVGVCGEAAGDPAMAAVLVGLGVTSLSMTTRSIPAVAATLKSLTLQEARQLAAECLASSDPDTSRRAARSRLPILSELGLAPV